MIARLALDTPSWPSNLASNAKPDLNYTFMRSETAEAIDFVFVLYCDRDPICKRRVRELIACYNRSKQPILEERGEILRGRLRKKKMLKLKVRRTIG
jgi:hypothetical protein